MIAFCHIPKTAGTSLNLSLRRYFGLKLLAARERKSDQHSYYKLLDMKKDLQVFKHIRCITGHGLKPWVDFGNYDKNLNWFTFMRDPYKRFVSLYVHQQTNNVKEKKMDLLSWSNTFDRSDGMVKMLAGEKNINKAIDILESKIKFIGLSEYYSLSLQLFINYYGLEGFHHESAGKRMISRDGELAASLLDDRGMYKDCIESNNQLDKQLYQYVLDNVWPKQLSSINLDFELSDKQLSQSENCLQQSKYLGFQLQDKGLYLPLLKLGIL